MAGWDSYTQKATPEDNDTLMIKDTAAGANKRTPFSGVWNWMLNKLTNAVISQLETSNKSIIPAINELNSKSVRYMGTASFKDFNDCPNNTVWWVSSITTENRPPVNENAYGQLINIGGFQLFFTYEYSNGIYSRWYINGNWTAWLLFSS